MKKIASIFLALIVAVSATGITIGKMECLFSGNITYSLGSANDCCDTKENNEASFESTCCKITSTHFGLSHFNLQHQQTEKSCSSWIFSHPINTGIFSNHLPQTAIFVFHSYHSPPSPSGKLLLTFISKMSV